MAQADQTGAKQAPAGDEPPARGGDAAERFLDAWEAWARDLSRGGGR